MNEILKDFKDYVIKDLKRCQESDDQENAHIDADKRLCDLLILLGYWDVVEEWNKIRKWYA